MEPDIAMPTEVEKFVERMAEKNVVHMHVDWGDDAANLTAEERAKALNDVDDWLSIPGNDISSRLRGEAMMMTDSITIAKLSGEVGKFKRLSQTKALMIEAAEFIEATVSA